jgi:hypothetical protein
VLLIEHLRATHEDDEAAQFDLGRIARENPG